MKMINIQQSLIGEEEVNSVDARALHKSLGNKKQFANWVNYQITSLGLVKNEDYVLLNQKVKQTSGEDNRGGHNAKEYLFTLDIAKHIALASRTKEGKEIRAYFIEVEKKYAAQNTMPQEAIMSLLTQMSESINMMAKNQGMIISRLEALESANMATPLAGTFETTLQDDSYTKEEEVQIMLFKSQGKTNDFIAQKLGRTNQAIRCKSTRLRAAVAAGFLARAVQDMEEEM